MTSRKKLEKELKDRSSIREHEFITPDYDEYCFSNIPSTVLSHFGIDSKRPTLPEKLVGKELEGSEKVVQVIIDGFGYTQWMEHAKKHSLLKRFLSKGEFNPITSIFPSTTAAAITTINTGLTPQEHGLPEWNVYMDEIDLIINTLPFHALGDMFPDSLLEEGADPSMLYKGKTIYQTLKKKGKVDSFVFLSEKYSHSAYSDIIFKGAKRAPYYKYSDLVNDVRRRLEEHDGPAYYYVYIGDLDTISHEMGPHSDEYESELSNISHMITKELVGKLKKGTAKETSMIVTADHGQIGVNPEDTIYLNRYKKLIRNLRKSGRMKSVWPSGSPRDVFLHVKPNKFDETIDYVENKLKNHAMVMDVNDAIDMRLFGTGKIHNKLIDRLGDILILPYKNNTVWFEFEKGNTFSFRGHHGGLTEEEMLVPFAVAKMSDLA
ncbi:MAG: alkaline phosphatase family protein [Kosmotogaceae bacterium]|nr:alkaline phosphatase family protein [Kosmotogaceae bacterium]